MLKDFEKRIKILSDEGWNCNKCRHELYDIRDCGEKLTQEEDVRVKQLCNREDKIDSEIRHLHELEENVYKALDELKENGNYSDSLSKATIFPRFEEKLHIN